LSGRIKVPFKVNKQQKDLLDTRKGGVDLCLTKRGKWLLLVPYKTQEKKIQPSTEFIGVDLGIVNLAVDSDGTTYSGDDVEQARRRYAHRRRNLQKKGTRSSKRKLKQISGREARFRRDVSHRISKAIVEKAQCTGRGIALENLKGIRKRVKARRKQRSRLHSWSFYQQQQFISYKAKIAGVETVFVNPAYTSQTCSQCGFCSRNNRPSRDRFKCGSCRFSVAADHNAALNIAFKARAAVNQPNRVR
jgi:IS605 OrfB family transposase